MIKYDSQTGSLILIDNRFFSHAIHPKVVSPPNSYFQKVSTNSNNTNMLILKVMIIQPTSYHKCMVDLIPEKKNVINLIHQEEKYPY